MTTYTDRITSKPMQVQSLNESARRGLVHALLTTYQRHMNNPLPPPPAMGEGLRLRGWNEPSDDELISMHQERLTDFYMRYCREFRVEVPVIPSGHVIDADGFLREAKKLIETLLWSRVYDLLEFWMARYPGPSKLADRLAERIDAVLKRENVDHRIVDRKFVPVSDDIEKEAVASATDATNVSAHVRTHIDKAAEFIRTGDYRQSAHESISAVEAQCRLITGLPKATPGEALQVLGEEWHKALVQSYSAMYGWSSDDSGIRHSLLPDAVTTVDYPLAKLILVQCAAFINYCVAVTDGTDPTMEAGQPQDRS